MPTIYTFNSPPNHRKFNKARQVRTQYKAVLNELVGDSTAESKAKFLKPITTQDVGIKCVKIT